MSEGCPVVNGQATLCKIVFGSKVEWSKDGVALPPILLTTPHPAYTIPDVAAGTYRLQVRSWNASTAENCTGGDYDATTERCFSEPSAEVMAQVQEQPPDPPPDPTPDPCKDFTPADDYAPRPPDRVDCSDITATGNACEYSVECTWLTNLKFPNGCPVTDVEKYHLYHTRPDGTTGGQDIPGADTTQAANVVVLKTGVHSVEMTAIRATGAESVRSVSYEIGMPECMVPPDPEPEPTPPADACGSITFSAERLPKDYVVRVLCVPKNNNGG